MLSAARFRMAISESRPSVARSRLMASVQRHSTPLELTVRRLVRGSGHRYRANVRSLPGSPDLVITALRKAIFVNGCFWHGHQECRLAKLPKTRRKWWSDKIEANRQRDKRKISDLRALGWQSISVWQCQLANEARVASRLRRFLS